MIVFFFAFLSAEFFHFTALRFLFMAQRDQGIFHEPCPTFDYAPIHFIWSITWRGELKSCLKFLYEFLIVAAKRALKVNIVPVNKI